MFLTPNGLALTRSLLRKLFCTCLPPCLLAGCANGPGRPAVDIPAALTSGQAVLGTPQPLPSEAVLSATAADDNSTAASSAPQPTSLASDSPPPLLLPEAIRFGLQNNPRLRAALAAIERARGEEAVAFAPFLPQVDLLNRFVATGKATLPGSPGPTGVVAVNGPGPYQVYQSELQLQWTLYDFGRTAGRYGQADLREKITQLRALRARETVAYDVATAYLQAREAAAFRRIAEETVRRAEAVLQDNRARREQG